MNNFGLLFEYSNNIRIFILLNKLPILAKISKKESKLGRNNRISCFRVDLHFALKGVNKLLNWIFRIF
jgi:hypothetical protein